MNQQQSGRWLGLDFGLARIGVAVSDAAGRFALPVSVIQTEKTLIATAEKLKKQLSHYAPLAGIVIGLPLLLSGKESPMAATIRIFGGHIETLFQTQIIYWDERFSSSQAERLLQDRGMRRKARAQVVDALAASTILQGFLESR